MLDTHPHTHGLVSFRWARRAPSARSLTLCSVNNFNTKGVGANAGVGQSAVGRARRPHGSGDGAGGCDTLGPAQRRHLQCKANLTICQPFDWCSKKISNLPKMKASTLDGFHPFRTVDQSQPDVRTLREPIVDWPIVLQSRSETLRKGRPLDDFR